MISPEQIRQKAGSWWVPFLRACLRGESFFPKKIERIGRVKAGEFMEKYVQRFEETELLYAHSKSRIGYGYTVHTFEKNFKKFRTERLPEYVQFDTAEDYVRYIGREKEWSWFKEGCALINGRVPVLKEWVDIQPEKVITHYHKWEDLLKVCLYFIENPRPALYVRELPIDVDTKFIEANQAIVRSLLDFLLPASAIRDKAEKEIGKRYYLKFDEPRVRIRVLDPILLKDHPDDISIRLSDFQSWTFPYPCRNVLLAENKMNTLTLPPIQSAIVIWTGGGFNISHLENVSWLSDKAIYYWGDLDAQGFEILHQMRCYYPGTKSMLMDKNTFRQYRHKCGEGKKSVAVNLEMLEIPEKALHKILKRKNLRLEQEKIPQEYVNAYVNRMIK